MHFKITAAALGPIFRSQDYKLMNNCHFISPRAKPPTENEYYLVPTDQMRNADLNYSVVRFHTSKAP